MRSTFTAVLTAAAIALPPANAVAAIRAAQAVPKKTVVTKKVTGPAAYADRWGTVAVTLTVRRTTTVSASGRRKVSRRIVAVDTTYDVHTGRSERIMEQALPILRESALASQSANVDLVSGATDTSYAFAESLQAALLLARKA